MGNQRKLYEVRTECAQTIQCSSSCRRKTCDICDSSCRGKLIQDIYNSFRNADPNHPYNEQFKGKTERYALGPKCEPGHSHLYRFQSLNFNHLELLDVETPVDRLNNYVLDKADWFSLKDYYEDGDLKNQPEIPSKSRITFWTGEGALLEKIESLRDLLSSALKLGMMSSYTKTLIVRIDRETYLQRNPRIPTELDGLDYAPFFQQPLHKLRTDSGITLDMNEPAKFKAGVPEYVLQNVRSSDVSVKLLDLSARTEDRSAHELRARLESTGQEPRTIGEELLFDKLVKFYKRHLVQHTPRAVIEPAQPKESLNLRRPAKGENS